MDLRRLATAFSLALAAAGCAQTPPPATREAAVDHVPPAGRVAEESRQRLLDENGDGLVDRDEADAFYRRRFVKLDDDNDGRLSRAELTVDDPHAQDVYQDLVGMTANDFAVYGMRVFNLRADRTTGMMSTADFGEMVGTIDPMVSVGLPQ